jgi:perosamine synthetase
VKKLDKITTTLPKGLKDILSKININEQGIIFIVNDDLKLIGSISDGDIRRSILEGKKITEMVSIESSLVNKNFVSAKYNSTIKEITVKLDEEINGKKIKCLPLIDDDGKILDIATKERIKSFPLSNLKINDEAINNVLEALTSGWLSSKGVYISKFEELFSNYLGGGNAIAVSSGTSAIELGLKSLGIGIGDEVLVPDFTFAASINAIINTGATPVIVDVEKETWTIDLNEINEKITNKTKAILPVHVYGQPCRIDEILSIAKAKNLFVIEDCAESLGAKYKNRLVGLDFDCSCHSFFANKTITTGEGGMVVFKDSNIAAKARKIMNHGMSEKYKYQHDFVGSNYRMTNLQAAVGVAEIKKVQTYLQERKRIFEIYDNQLKDFSSIGLLPNNNWSENSFWLYTILLKNFYVKERNDLINKLSKHGIECRPGFMSLSKMKPYEKYADRKLQVSNYLSDKSISLPSSKLSEKDQEFILETLIKEMKKK